MLAFQVSINGETTCIVSSNDVVSVDALLHGEHFPNDDISLAIGGTVQENGRRFHASWLKQPLSLGDTVTLEVVSVDQNSLSPPTSTEPFPTSSEAA